MTENYEKFIQSLEDCPNICKGIEIMCKVWQSNKRLIKSGKTSLEFVHKGSLGSQNHVFRVERMRKGIPPTLTAYSGDPQRTGVLGRPGSPMISSTTAEDKEKLKRDFGLIPANLDGSGDWRRDLDEDIPREYYIHFVEHAMRMCRGRNK